MISTWIRISIPLPTLCALWKCYVEAESIGLESTWPKGMEGCNTLFGYSKVSKSILLPVIVIVICIHNTHTRNYRRAEERQKDPCGQFPSSQHIAAFLNLFFAPFASKKASTKVSRT